MERSPGVSAVAVVALACSILILGLGLLTAGLALIVPHIPSPAGERTGPPALFMLAASLMYVLPGIWGVVSGIGLWRLKNWARLSTLVFAAFAGLGGLAALAIAFLFFSNPLPTSGDIDPVAAARIVAIMRGAMLTVSVALLGTAIWWGVLLTRPAAVRQFTGTGDPAMVSNRRPLSITIIGALMVVSAPFTLFSLLMRLPMPLFLTILSGSAVVAYSLIVAAVLGFCGVGLLKLMPAARLVAIAYFAFIILNSAVFFLAPGRDARFAALMNRQRASFTLSLAPDAPPPFPPGRMMLFGVGIGLLWAGLPLYFLATRGKAFEPAEADPIWPDAPG